MIIIEQYHNVSVRLKDDEYNKLLFLHDKFNRMSYGKVSLADVLRIAIREIHVIESADSEKPITIEKQLKQRALDRKEEREQQQQQELQKEEEHNKANTDQLEAFKDVLSTDKPIAVLSIAEQLEAFKKQLQDSLNSKGKPYSDKHIKQQLEKKRLELEEEQQEQQEQQQIER